MDAELFDIGGDHPASSAANDPFSDAVYWYEPADTSPGERGYDSYFSGSADLGREVFAEMVLVEWNGGEERPYDAALPEAGTVFRILTGENMVPVLSSPVRARTVPPGTVSFYWDSSPEYGDRLQVATGNTFAEPVIDVSNVAPGFQAELIRTGSYYWRVETPRTGWSKTASLVVSASPKPTPTTPVAQTLLFQNFPNPFDESTTIIFFLPDEEHVRITLYDTLGRRITDLLDAEMGPGRHSIPFQSESLSSGVYFYRLSGKGTALIRSMTRTN
jgi:hypothetical protein